MLNDRRSTMTIHDDHKLWLLSITVFLFIVVMLLTWLILSLSVIKDTFKETKTEVRLLQMHVQDQNAILIRQGIVNPADMTDGATNPKQIGVKNERDSM